MKMCVALSWLIASCALAQGDPDFVKLEQEHLRTCDPMRDCDVMFVSALDGIFPLPTRFLLVDGPGSDQLTFHSPARMIITGTGEGIVGTISIGSRKNLEESRAAGDLSLSLLKTLDGVEVYRMESRIKSAAPSLKRDMYVLLGTKDYIMIIDDNRDLAITLLRLRARIERVR
jgi:hypothetical protein